MTGFEHSLIARFEQSRKTRIEPQHREWVESYAARVHRRMQASGCRTLQVEDVQQECWIAYTKATQSYRADCGASFGTYLYRGMELHTGRWSRTQVGLTQATAMGDDAITVAEAACDDLGESQEEALGRQQHRARVLDRMSAKTRQVVALLDAPPAWLMDEFRAMRAKVAWCRQRRFVAFGSKDISLPLIFQAIGLDRAEQRAVQAEIRSFI